MKPQTTPGPWFVSPTHQGQIVSARRIIADVAAQYPTTRDEQAANARLIAAAPKLLAAFRHLCGAFDMSDVEHASFADSCADVVEYLWLLEDPRPLLAEIEGAEP